MSRARVPHIIRPNKSGAGPQSWLVFSLTTNPVLVGERKWRHDFKTASAISWRPNRGSKAEREVRTTWTDRVAFVEYVVSLVGSKERVGVICHDMDFAAQVLDIHCTLRGLYWRPTRLVIERGRWSQRWRKGDDKEHDGGRSLLWLDLYNFYPTTLRQVARWFGLDYRPLPSEGIGSSAVDSYREQNVSITFAALKLWLDFLERFDLGYFAGTLASQAFNAYRHRFMDHPIYVHVHDDVLTIERAANIGGRCEMFWQGRAPRDDYVQVDMTSFYASVQYGQVFPVKQVGHAKNVGLGKLRDIMDRYSVIARVELITEKPQFPKRTDDGIIFPVGRYRTTLCTPELRDAVANGNVWKVEELVTYESAPIFDRYIEFFWDIRRRAMDTDDRYLVELAKRFLTALYGKFGQRIWLSNLIRTGLSVPDRIWKEYDWQDAKDYEYRIIAGRMERQVREVMGRETLLAIPAHVTSYGRQKLWELIELIGLENVFYCDTDSLILSRRRLNAIGHLFERHKLGGLKLINTSTHLFIRAPKWYLFGNQTKRSGIKLSAREVRFNVFEQEENRTIRWCLQHDNPCAAIVEEVKLSGPLRTRINTSAMGKRMYPLRYGDEPMHLSDGTVVPPLPLSPVP